MDRATTIRKLRERLASWDKGIVCAYLFGSYARGDERRDSDLDVAVLLAQEPRPTLDGLQTDLCDALAEAAGKPVDLIVLNRAPVDLVHRVLRDGILLLERDRGARVRFEVQARNQYFDLLPYLERYRRGSRGEAA